MRRLVLHVGPGRTGTSALQTMFSRHAGELLAQGVHFPTWPGIADAVACKVTSGNGGPLAALISPRAGVKHYAPEDGIQRLRNLHDEQAMTVLYSHEGLALFEPERLGFAADMALSAGFVTQAVYYTRNPAQYARSSYARWCESGEANLPWQQFNKDPPFPLHIKRLRQTLGASNVIVRDYDAAKPDLFADFCSALMIDRPPGAMPIINASKVLLAA